MSLTKKIPADFLKSHGVMEGDTLRILATVDASFVVEISSPSEPTANQGKVEEWLKTALGSVHTTPHETADDARMAYYRAKYGSPIGVSP